MLLKRQEGQVFLSFSMKILVPIKDTDPLLVPPLFTLLPLRKHYRDGGRQQCAC